MSSWVIVGIGFLVVGALVLVAKRWGEARAERRILEKNIEAAKNRKAIDNDTENLTPDELADELRRFM